MPITCPEAEVDKQPGSPLERIVRVAIEELASLNMPYFRWAKWSWFPVCAILTLAAVGAAYSYIAWTPILNDFGGDSAVYLHMARYYSPFLPADPVAAFFARQSQYPPVYPLLLALTGGANDLLLAHQLTSSLLVAALVVFFFWAREEGVGRWPALAFAVLGAMLPGLNTQAMYLLSEAPFLLFCGLALYALMRLRRGAAWRWTFIGAAASAAAYLTRSVGLAMVLVWLAFVLVRKAKHWRTAVLACLLPVACWGVFSPRESASYLDILRAKMSDSETGSWLDFLVHQVLALANGWKLDIAGIGTSHAGAYLIGAACLAAWVYRLVRGKADAWFVAAYLAMVLLWPFPAESARLVMPLLLVLLLELLICVTALTWTLPGVRGWLPTSAVLGMVFLSSLPHCLGGAARFQEPIPDKLENYRRTSYWFDAQPYGERLAQIQGRQRVDTALQNLSSLVPAQDCIYSIKPSLVGFHAGRISRATPARIPDDTATKPGHCRYVYMLPLITPSYSSSLYPLNEWREHLEIFRSDTVDPRDERSPLVGLLARIRPAQP